MPKVDFYVLEDPSSTARLRFACKLIEKAYHNQYSLDVLTTDTRISQQIDDLLWTFRDGSFIPHELYDANRVTSPVLIGSDFSDRIVTPGTPVVLVNLGTEIPGYFDRYQRITEVVSADPVIRQQARCRFQFYRDKGHEPESHNII
ncbi:MAG: DNA polymerase III subunit chi [Thiohalomonadales bacterium]